jgi:diaminopimelate epimerase
LIYFHKYQGTGNDFVMIDDRENKFDLHDHAFVKHVCDRRFGVGADGLILLRLSAEAHFEMVYYNSDGNLSSMCGNGGRCIARFAQSLGIIDSHCTFMAADGPHQAELNEKEVSLKMKDVNEAESNDGFYFLDTGSPHYIEYKNNLEAVNVFAEGQSIRYNSRFKGKGTNVNFVEFLNGILNIRTYERGVEDETLSCGTGVTASALAHAIHEKFNSGTHSVNLQTPGGMLKVKFDFDGRQAFSNVYLIGPAEFVFQGEFPS